MASDWTGFVDLICILDDKHDKEYRSTLFRIFAEQHFYFIKSKYEATNNQDCIQLFIRYQGSQIKTTVKLFISEYDIQYEIPYTKKRAILIAQQGDLEIDKYIEQLDFSINYFFGLLLCCYHNTVLDFKKFLEAGDFYGFYRLKKEPHRRLKSATKR